MKNKLRPISYLDTDIKGGFWYEKQKLFKDTVVNVVYDRFKQTGRIGAFDFTWREGMPNKPHVFWDSDVAKWMEGAAYILAKENVPQLRERIETLVDRIIENQGDDGYFNIYYTLVEPNGRFTNRNNHELYCAGHLIEAAVAYYEATGERRFLDAMCRYADYIDLSFRVKRDTAFVTPGHEEIELALFRLYECTGEKRYYTLAEFFINERGLNDKPIADGAPLSGVQSHLPVRRQLTAEGHAVRACYLYSAMADLAAYTDDAELITACKALFGSIRNRRMYITGGIGSSSSGEAFTIDYDLPNQLAYSETCAAIALALFSGRMLTLERDAKYAETVERTIYNGILSGVSLDGRSFFYENPLEILPHIMDKDKSARSVRVKYPLIQRSEIFPTSCCPCNLVRFIPSVSSFIFGDDGECVYIHQLIDSETVVRREGRELRLRLDTRYPTDGRVTLTVYGGDLSVAIRMPRGSDTELGEDGYAHLALSDGVSVTLHADLTPKFIESDPRVLDNAGKCAVMRGPIVYCMESVDNGAGIRNLRIDTSAPITEGDCDDLGIPELWVTAYRRVSQSGELYREGISTEEQIKVRLIPYYAMVNRGVSEMQVWHLYK